MDEDVGLVLAGLAVIVVCILMVTFGALGSAGNYRACEKLHELIVEHSETFVADSLMMEHEWGCGVVYR